MSEIKPVYQVQQLGEWIEVDKSIFDELYIQNKFPHRILYPAAAYEALQKENAELKRNHKFTCENLANTVPFIEELEQKNAAQAKRITEQLEAIEATAEFAKAFWEKADKHRDTRVMVSTFQQLEQKLRTYLSKNGE